MYIVTVWIEYVYEGAFFLSQIGRDRRIDTTKGMHTKTGEGMVEIGCS